MFSLGEAEALAVKAARGVAAPWGLAEEAGFAVRWLESRGLDGIGALESWCRLRPEASACPLSLGCRASDEHCALPLSLFCLVSPILALPLIARCHDDAVVYQMTRQKNGWGIAFSKGPRCPPTHTRVPDNRAGAWDALSSLAARTYAPATEASRRLGAGSADD